MSYCKNWHFETNQTVLNRSGEVVGRVARNPVRQRPKPLQNRQEESLPIGGKDNELNAKEFWNRPEWRQVVMHANPEYRKRIQTYCNAHIIHNPSPEVSGRQSQVAFLVGISGFHKNGDDS